MTSTCPYCEPGQCRVGYGICHCGCGKETPRHITATNRQRVPVGTPHKWINGHWNYDKRYEPPEFYTELERRREAYLLDGVCPWCEPDMCPVGAGQCHCGCGQRALVARHNDATREVLKGMPRKVLKGHAPTKVHLTPAQVRRMRYRYATTDVSQEALGIEYGISQAAVSRILRFDHYADAGIATSDEEEG